MIEITPVAVFSDNYIWFIVNRTRRSCHAVDPGEAEAVENWLEHHQLKLEGIVLTHHHHDHTGGVEALTADRRIPVFGSLTNRCEAITERLAESNQIDVQGVHFTVMETPGHTLDHITYYAEPKGRNPVLFSGDTLFSAGCGRLFEGTAEQMHNSLQKLARLPAETEIYPAHEYTLANLQFAREVEPHNQAVLAALDRARRCQKSGQPTLPSTLAAEREINPFLRTDHPEVASSVKTHTPFSTSTAPETFAALRTWKDRF